MRGSSLFEVTAVLVWLQLKQSQADNAPDYAAGIGFFIFLREAVVEMVCVCVYVLLDCVVVGSLLNCFRTYCLYIVMAAVPLCKTLCKQHILNYNA